jgi:hypothetical protein
MTGFRVLRGVLTVSALTLALLPPVTPAQSECEELRRECADYCRYGPVAPDRGRQCKEECRQRVLNCQRGMRAAEGYPTYGAPGGYGYGAPGYGAPPVVAPAAPVPYALPAPAYGGATASPAPRRSPGSGRAPE